MSLTTNPTFGVAVTVLVYTAANALHDRRRWIHPLLVTCITLIALLKISHIDIKDYRKGGDLIAWFLGPATIALGVPFYKNAQKIGRQIVPVTIAVTTGAVAGIASAALFVKLARGSSDVFRSMLPKSVTTPISIELSKQLGGTPELTAVFTVLAGLIGSVVGPMILRFVGVRRDVPLGIAIGASSHGIGTARVLRDSELQGAASGFAMALCGVITSLLTIPARWLLHLN